MERRTPGPGWWYAALFVALGALAGCLGGEGATPGTTPCGGDDDCDPGWYCDQTLAEPVCKQQAVGPDASGDGSVEPDTGPPPACTGTADCAEYEDGNLCNGTLVCDDGACVVDASTLVACTGGTTCAPSVCNPPTGTCQIQHADDGTPCEQDADDCTVEACDGGVCVFDHIDTAIPACVATDCTEDEECDDGNVCTEDRCDGQHCAYQSRPNGILCDDGDPCTGGDACFSGQCEGDPLDCDDDNACTIDSCDPDHGCRHELDSTKPGCQCKSAEECPDDGNVCTNEACKDGVCTTTPILCDDFVPCTIDSCDPETGCVFEPDPFAVEQCNNNIDDDCNGLTDCSDPACAAGCNEECGGPISEFACGNPYGGGGGYPGEPYPMPPPPPESDTSYVDTYSCSAGSYPGYEIVYTYTPVQDTTLFLYAGVEMMDEGSLFLLQDTCAGMACVASYSLWDYKFEIALEGGVTYYFVLDAPYEGPIWVYDFWAECSEPEICDDLLDNDWDGEVDCADSDCKLADPICEAAESSCGDAFDNDGDGKIDCADLDCKSGPPCEMTETTCDDGVDNDADSLTDCADNNCDGEGYCEFIEASCDDGFDNDGDGATDCKDANCAQVDTCTAQCGPAVEVITCGDYWYKEEPYPPSGETGTSYLDVYNCINEQFPGAEQVFEITPDNDGTMQIWAYGDPYDGLRTFILEGSCDSASCVAVSGQYGEQLTHQVLGGHTYYVVVDSTYDSPMWLYDFNVQCSDPEDCNDGYDNDWDGKVDCADIDCLAAGPPCEAAETTCDDDLDNDGDGWKDCQDANCQLAGDPCEPTETICDDNVDNDGDGMTDCAEPSCNGDPICEPIEVSCDDGVDNDGDGLVDCTDGNCALDPANECVAECKEQMVNIECGDYLGYVEQPYDAKSSMTVYNCSVDEWLGAETIWRFTATTTQTVEFSTYGDPWPLGIFVLEENCDTTSCIDMTLMDGGYYPYDAEPGAVPMPPGGGGTLSVEVVAGNTYYFVADNQWGGPTWTYETQLNCY